MKSAFSKSGDGFDYKKIEDQLLSEPDKNETTKIYTPDQIDSSSCPAKIKVEISTRLETAWLYSGLASSFMAFMLYLCSLETKKHPANAALLTYIPYFIGLASIFALLWFLTDNFYIMHTDKRKLLYHFKFFGISKITPVTDFENIKAIGVSGRRTYNKNREIWSYYIFMADKTGKITALSDHEDECKLNKLNAQALAMARCAQCPFAKAAPNTEIRINKRGTDISLNYLRFGRPQTGLDELKQMIKGDHWKALDKNLKIRIVSLLIFGAIIIVMAVVYFPDIIKSFEPK